MTKRKMIFGLNTVRKKVLLLSKLAGGSIVLFYLFTSELPTSRSIAFWIWFVLLVFVIVGVDALLGHFISKPLRSITKVARKMANLDFPTRCEIHTDDEFGALSDSLNSMSSNLQAALKALETANEQLEKDVEQERLLLDQRKELADSLSHEMKNPLGIIRAYAEGLKDETDEIKKEHYVDVILLATDRMGTLIGSLLDLSALESGAVTLANERFDFIELVETVAGRLLLDTPNPNYHFHYELPEAKVFIFADRQRIEQVLENLIENAKKYVSDGGEIRLSVTYDKKAMLSFSVFNQGTPIPDGEHSKIWLKFYRGENSQGGQQHGSGLGLAIVAQILSMYQVKYGVHNQQSGTAFYFSFPTIK